MEGVSANPIRVQVVSFFKSRMADTPVDFGVGVESTRTASSIDRSEPIGYVATD